MLARVTLLALLLATSAHAYTPATSGTPRIDQVRGGKVIATYQHFADDTSRCAYKGDGTDWQTPGVAAATGCGPFTRSHGWRLWAPGDVFVIWPAVYGGLLNQAWIGPEWDSPNAVGPTPMTAIKLRGLVVNGIMPTISGAAPISDNTLNQASLYLAESDGLVIERLAVVGTRSPSPVACVADVAASNLIMRDVRITNCEPADGILTGWQYKGTTLLERVEFDHNGGTGSAYNHDAYFAGSSLDPNFTLTVRCSHFHDAWQGHLFKSRAQNSVFVNDWFEGGTPQPGLTPAQAEAFLLDVPNGGNLTVRSSLFVKTASGPNSNGIEIAFDEEGSANTQEVFGYPAERAMSATITGTAFVAITPTFDGTHPNIPMVFGKFPGGLPAVDPATLGMPLNVSSNSFTGFAPMAAPYSYRGTNIAPSIVGAPVPPACVTAAP